MEFIVNHWTDIFACIGIAVTLATAIVHLTPSVKDDEVLAKVVKVVNVLSVINPKPPKA
jgi:hypothetical protein